MIVFDLPYTHIRCTDFLALPEYEAMKRSVSILNWEFYNKGSYVYKVSSIDYESPFYLANKGIIQKFTSEDFIAALSIRLDARIERCTDFSFHRMEVGDFSCKHTDQNAQSEIVRVVYYLSEPCSYQGGKLVLYDA